MKSIQHGVRARNKNRIRDSDFFDVMMTSYNPGASYSDIRLLCCQPIHHKLHGE